MIHYNALDFRECRSEEVMFLLKLSVGWRDTWQTLKSSREFWIESYVLQIANADSYLQVNHLSRSWGVGVLSCVQDGDPTTGHLLLKEAYNNENKHTYLYFYAFFSMYSSVP